MQYSVLIEYEQSQNYCTLFGTHHVSLLSHVCQTHIIYLIYIILKILLCIINKFP